MTISTPCVKRCDLDEASGLCLGCGRTMADIMAWSRMTEAARHAIMVRLPARLALAEERAGRDLIDAVGSQR